LARTATETVILLRRVKNISQGKINTNMPMHPSQGEAYQTIESLNPLIDRCIAADQFVIKSSVKPARITNLVKRYRRNMEPFFLDMHVFAP
jgi:hypothetical protein